MKPHRWLIGCSPVIGGSVAAWALMWIFALAIAWTTPSPAQATASLTPHSFEFALAPASTIITQNITTGTTWTLAGSPYEIAADIVVTLGVTLTVEAGVQVRFNQYTKLDVNGRLLAQGSPSAPITFTANTTSPVPGWWGGLRFIGTDTAPLTGSSLNYVTVEYGGYNVAYGNLHLENATVKVTNSLFRNSILDGIHGRTQGVAHIANSRFVGNAGYAVYFTDGTVNPVLSNITASGNGTDAIALGSQGYTVLQGNHVWEKLAIPYLVTYGTAIQVGPTATLTIEPGTLVQFGQFASLLVNGQLTAQGTFTSPITFTASISTPTPGWWGGIYFYGTAGAPATGSNLNYVTVEYGGYNTGANLRADDAVVTVTNAIFRYSNGDGVFSHYGGIPNVSNSRFLSNTNYAMYIFDGSLNPQLANLTASGNGFNAIALGGGTRRGTHTWQAAGLPYVVLGGQTVDVGSTLIVEPGVEVRFGQYVELTVWGRLLALGTPSAPITFTAHTTAPVPGWWGDIRVWSPTDTPAEGTVLEYATVEYGGYNFNANVYVANGKLAISHSLIHYSSGDGIVASYGGGASTIEFSQIISNTQYGIRNNDPSSGLLAQNNWWGSASGPTYARCNPSGTGSLISDRVIFRPFLTSPNQQPGPLTPGDAHILSITPRSWFVLADGLSRAWFDISLRDGNGQPLPGRQVRLISNLGTVVDGGFTDVQGRSFAYITSSTPGDADVRAVLDLLNACETARSPSANITFVSSLDTGGGVFPPPQAPYLNEGLQVVPRPIVQGVPSYVQLRFTNPNPYSISVDVSFSYAQLGIGLTFGPLGSVRGYLIPPNGSGLIQQPFTPLFSGHFCIQYQYVISPVGGARLAAQVSGGGQSNFDAQPAPLVPKRENDIIAKGRKVTHAVEYGHLGAEVLAEFPAGAAKAPSMLIQGYMAGKIVDFNLTNGSKAAGELAGQEDPPRQDYTTLATLETFTFPPLQPGPNFPVARAAAANVLISALLDMTAKLRAARISRDRYAGASAAADLQWASQQAAAMFYYKQQAGAAMMVVADKLDAYLQELRNEGIVEITVSVEDVRAYQHRLRTQGFNAEELDAARLLKMTDEELERIRQLRINVNPEQLAGSQLTLMANVAAAFREMGQALSTEPAVIGGGLLRATQTITNQLASVSTANFTMAVGNPLTQTANVVLRVRRLDVPSDWMISVTPPNVTLAPGAVTTATVTVQPGTATVQGARPRIAIEGYVNNQLMGGVVLDVMVPMAATFDGKLRTYLPLLQR